MTDIRKEMASFGKAIGNETRFRILELLIKNPLNVGEITKKIGLSQPTVSQHLKLLKSLRLVSDERKGQEIVYTVNVLQMINLFEEVIKVLKTKK